VLTAETSLYPLAAAQMVVPLADRHVGQRPSGVDMATAGAEFGEVAQACCSVEPHIAPSAFRLPPSGWRPAPAGTLGSLQAAFT
jgi:hypothetical protein